MNTAYTPEWLNDAVFYQIMPDRFARAVVPGQVLGDSSLVPWSARPGSSGRGGGEFYGGNLRGICGRLGHIAELGANTLLLTPINQAPSYHRYDTVDFFALDPLLGDWNDLEMLISEAHRRNMRLIFDVALNHVSSQHQWFKKAVADPQAIERDYFTFDIKGNYRCWWGYKTLPELNLSNNWLQQELFAGERNVLGFWLDKGFDGVRLDCANDLSLAMCKKIVAATRARYPDAAIIGEVANFSLPWLEVLDATQSYFFTASLKALHAECMTTRQFVVNMQTAYGTGFFRQFQMLSSHDTPRINTEWKKCPEFLRAARRLQFTLPGLPMIYYGEEMAMQGKSDPDNRATPDWTDLGAVNKSMEFVELRHLADLRKKSPELARGIWEPVFVDGFPDLCAFYRTIPENPHNLTLVTWNNSTSSLKPTLTIPWGWLFSEVQLQEVFTGRLITSVAGLVTPTLEPGECAIWQVKDGSKRNYSFFKNWEK